MDDRDKDLTHLFVRDLDEIPLPPRGEWRRAQGGTIAMRSRYLLTAGTVAAVLGIALIVGFQLNERLQSAADRSASPTPFLTSVPIVVRPSPTANPNGTATPAVSGSPASDSSVYNDDFGFIVAPGDVPVANIRRESSNATIGSLRSAFSAVSPDGKQQAFFTLAADAQELQVMDAAGTGAPRTLVKLSSDERGGGVVWSNDGGALLYSTEKGNFGVGGGGNSATLNVYELAASGHFHGTTIDTQANTGWLYRPIAFDRYRDIPLAVAQLTGEGGAMAFYVTVRQEPDQTFGVARVDMRSKNLSMGSIHASTDATLVLGVSFSGDISWWPTNDIAAARTLAGAGNRGALWRPNTHQLAYIAPDGHAANDPFWLGNVDVVRTEQLCCVAVGGLSPTARLETFRADGSAALFVVVPASAGLGATYEYTLIRLPREPQGGLEYPTSGDRVTFQSIGRIVASIRLR